MTRADDEREERDTTGEAVVAAVAALADELPRLERAAAADEPDGVHQARIQVRRLRSLLGATASLFAGGAADEVRFHLERLGDDLGEVRDLEVRIRHAEEHVGVGADEALVERLILSQRARYREAHAELAASVDAAGDAHDALGRFVAEPPYAEAARAPVAAGVAVLLAEEVRRVRRGARTSLGDLDSLHRFRRRARRLRYVAEALTDGPRAELSGGEGELVAALAAAAKEVQDVLGDHRDALLFALQVERAKAAAFDAGEAVEEYPGIAAAAYRAATERIEALPEAWIEFRERARTVEAAMQGHGG